VYLPVALPQRLEELFAIVMQMAAEIDDPFEQAFFLMVHLPYLQPFEDVNKRVSRLAANIPLIRHNLCPLSFIDVSQQAHKNAMIGVYERHRERQTAVHGSRARSSPIHPTGVARVRRLAPWERGTFWHQTLGACRVEAKAWWGGLMYVAAAIRRWTMGRAGSGQWVACSSMVYAVSLIALLTALWRPQ
jgi:hypothetical protein